MLARLPALSRFGPYELLGRLAVGGMAEIFLAREPPKVQGGPPRHLVIKRMLAQVAADPELVEMFMDEARLAMRLRHPGIVHVYELGQHEGAYFLSMEWVDGVSLGKLIRRTRDPDGGIPAPVAVKIISLVAEALQYAHQLRGDNGEPLRLVHRDVSPQNIMVSYDGATKLLDFGIAHSVERRTKTQQGQVRGKLAYMSPEQCMGERIDARSDVYALGVCLWEALTGRPLFHRSTQYETMKAVVEEDPPPVHRIAGHDLDEIVKRALAKNVDDRFASAGVFQVELERWLAVRAEVVPAARVSELVVAALGHEAHGGPLVDPDQSRFGDSIPPAPEPSDEELLQAETAESGPGAIGPVASEVPAPSSMGPPPRQSLPKRYIAVAVLTVLTAVGLAAWIALVPPEEPPLPQVQLPLPPAPAPAPAARAPVTEEPQAEAPMEVPALEATAEPASSAEERPVASEMRPRRRRPRPAMEAEIPSEPEQAPSPQEEEEEEEGATALVSINTRPWSKVYIGPRLIGTTPIGRVSVPAGPVRLRFVDRDGNEKHESVDLAPGSHERLFVDLSSQP